MQSKLHQLAADILLEIKYCAGRFDKSDLQLLCNDRQIDLVKLRSITEQLLHDDGLDCQSMSVQRQLDYWFSK